MNANDRLILESFKLLMRLMDKIVENRKNGIRDERMFRAAIKARNRYSRRARKFDPETYKNASELGTLSIPKQWKELKKGDVK